MGKVDVAKSTEHLHALAAHLIREGYINNYDEALDAARACLAELEARPPILRRVADAVGRHRRERGEDAADRP